MITVRMAWGVLCFLLSKMNRLLDITSGLVRSMAHKVTRSGVINISTESPISLPCSTSIPVSKSSLKAERHPAYNMTSRHQGTMWMKG